MNLTGMFRADVMQRQVTESVMIGKVEDHQLISTKREWNYNFDRTIIVITFLALIAY